MGVQLCNSVDCPKRFSCYRFTRPVPPGGNTCFITPTPQTCGQYLDQTIGDLLDTQEEREARKQRHELEKAERFKKVKKFDDFCYKKDYIY